MGRKSARPNRVGPIKIARPYIVSASRRTDVAFAADRLAKAFRAGSIHFKAPFRSESARIDLNRESIHGVVFWTRDPIALEPTLEHLKARAIPFYIQMTITDYPSHIEPDARLAPEEAIAAFNRMVSRFGAEAMVWRFDPILLSRRIGIDQTIARFERLSSRLSASADEVIISFFDRYKKVNARIERALASHDDELIEPTRDKALELIARIGEIGASRSIKVSLCCEPDLIGERVRTSACIDPMRLIDNGAGPSIDFKRAPTRKGCRCHKSIDIGSYRTCQARCLYCYAS